MNTKQGLSKEEIQFYTERRKQYTKDFLLMQKQFDPKLNKLTKLLIARKQITAPRNNNFTLPLNKKCNKVFTSLTMSSDIQKKIDNALSSRSSKFTIDTIPKYTYDCQGICTRILSNMIPLSQRIDSTIQQEINDQKIIQNELELNDQFNEDSEIYKQYLRKEKKIDLMQIRTQRIHDIITEVSLTQRKNAYNKYKALNNNPLQLQKCRTSTSHQVVDAKKLQEITKFEEMIKFEKWKLKEHVENELKKQQNLENLITTSLQRLGLKQKIFNMEEMQQFMNKCQQHTQKIIEGFQSERSDYKLERSKYFHSFQKKENPLSTKYQDSSDNQFYSDNTEMDQIDNIKFNTEKSQFLNTNKIKQRLIKNSNNN